MLTGSSPPLHEPGLPILEAMRRTTPLTREVFIRAVLGAAITQWALLPSPGPERDEVSRVQLEALECLNQRGEDGTRSSR
jgi:hypothetical protein